MQGIMSLRVILFTLNRSSID